MKLGLDNYYYTEKESKQILKSLVYLVDTREKENEHIISVFEKMGLAYKTRALGSGDYSVMIPENKELGIMRDIYLNSQIIIERKNSLEELSGNLAQHRQRFENELFRTSAVVHLVVENGSWAEILNGNYRTNLMPKSFYRSLLCLQAEYPLKIHFIERKLAGFHIQQILECYVKELLELN